MDRTTAFTAAAAHIMQKAEYAGLPEAFVNATLEHTFKQLSAGIQKKLQARIATCASLEELRKSPAYEQWFKQARAQLRISFGRFAADDQGAIQARRQAMVRYATAANESSRSAALQDLLESHPSTRERAASMLEITDFCFQGLNPNSKGGKRYKVIDLGCGINIANAAVWPRISAYLGYDLATPDEAFLTALATAAGLHAATHALDLAAIAPDAFLRRVKQDAPAVGATLPFDICFLWKTADVLEAQKRGVTQHLLRTVPARRLVVSFATRSLGGKRRIDPRTRAWFAHFLGHEGWTFETLETPTEFFYRIDRA